MRVSVILSWLAAFVLAYWAYCVYWGVSTGRMTRTASDYFLADRQIPPWVFILAATGTSLSGWMLLGQPAFVFRDGFQFAEVSLCAVTIPLAGVLFLKRQWLLGRRFGYVTAGEMFADYFQTDFMRLVLLVVTLVFAVPFVGMQLAASGRLIAYLTDGAIDADIAMWVLSAVVFLYVCFGGMRAVAYIGTLQTLLLGAGIIALGLIAYGHLGGINAFNHAMARLGATTIGPWGANAQGFNGYFEIPGVVQFTTGLDRTIPVGGPWTAVMILSYGFALMGIQAAPPFSAWAFATREIKGFGSQQVWVSAAAAGAILVIFGTAQGMGANFLGGSSAIGRAGLALGHLLPNLAGTETVSLVASYIKSISAAAPWFGAILAVCALAAIQVMAAFYICAGGTTLARDVYRRFLRPDADDRLQKLYGRIGVGLIAFAALLMASFAPVTEAELGALALAFGLQLLPSLAGICWIRWITRQGAAVGLVAGLAAVIFTEKFGEAITLYFGFELPWGRWPWTIHSAAWGIFVNVVACVIVSALTQDEAANRHRKRFHDFLAEHANTVPLRRGMRSFAWSISLAWLFFALGPGAVIGNDLFGAPNGGVASWRAGIPSLWAWQLAWWALGVLVIWFLAYRMGLSTAGPRRLEFYVPEAGSPPPPISLGEQWRPWFWGFVAAAAAVAGLHWIFG